MFYHFGKQDATEDIILILVSVKHTFLQIWRQYLAIEEEVLFLHATLVCLIVRKHN